MDENDARMMFLKSLSDAAESHLGLEGTEQLHQDYEFFETLIPTTAFLESILLTALVMRDDLDDEGIDFVCRLALGSALAGMECYRQFLADRGYDMLKLEGRE